jgi:hypothetical protein
MNSFSTIILAITFTVLVHSCKKDSEPPPVAPTPVVGMFKMEFENGFGSRDLKLNDSVYINSSGDSLRFSAVNYYISNVKLTKTDGSTWSEPSSYHLVQLSSPVSALISISNVPAGNYSGYSFTIGVDSLRNVSGAQSGALDIINGMFWDWNSGYKFIVIEGTSPQSSMMGAFEYHIGGFKNSNGTNALQTFSHSFNGQTMNVKPMAAPQIHTHIDLAMFFNGSALNLGVGSTPMVHMPGMNAVKLSTNFKEGIEFEHIHN